jgi:putative transcriptional regulator
MSACVSQQLPDFLLGGLPEADAARVQGHLGACVRCTRELDELAELLGALPLTLEAVEASAALRDRVLASTRGGRFADFARRFAAMFDVAVDRARQLLDLVDDPSSWEAGPCPGSGLIHFQAGPATAGADTGFVRVKPGVRFPWHSHGGRETTLVLQGYCRDSNGETYRRGDVFVNEADTAHEFRVPEEAELDYIFAVVVFGVDFEADKPAGAPSA